MHRGAVRHVISGRPVGEEQSNKGGVGEARRRPSPRLLITSEWKASAQSDDNRRLALPLSLARAERGRETHHRSPPPPSPPPSPHDRRTLPTYIKNQPALAKAVGSTAYLLMAPLPSSVARPLLMVMKPTRRCNTQNFKSAAALAGVMAKHIKRVSE